MAAKKATVIAPVVAEVAADIVAAETVPGPAGAVPQAAVPEITQIDTAPVPQAAPAESKVDVSLQVEKVMKTAEEFVVFGQGNLEAFVKAGQIWATGMQDLTKQFAATAQAQVDQTMAAFKAMATVKSVKEAIDLQSAHARSTMEAAMAETSKLTDASLKLTEQTLAPITARVTLAMEKFARAA